jgi:hypothetical protein
MQVQGTTTPARAMVALPPPEAIAESGSIIRDDVAPPESAVTPVSAPTLQQGLTRPGASLRSLSNREYGDVGGPPSPQSPVFNSHDVVHWDATREALRRFVNALAQTPYHAQSSELDTAHCCAMLAERMDFLGLTLTGKDDLALQQRRMLTFMASNARVTTMRTTLALAIACELNPQNVQADAFAAFLSELVITSSQTQLFLAQYLVAHYAAAPAALAPVALDVTVVHAMLVQRRTLEASQFTASDNVPAGAHANLT